MALMHFIGLGRKVPEQFAWGEDQEQEAAACSACNNCGELANPFRSFLRFEVTVVLSGAIRVIWVSKGGNVLATKFLVPDQAEGVRLVDNEPKFVQRVVRTNRYHDPSGSVVT